MTLCPACRLWAAERRRAAVSSGQSFPTTITCRYPLAKIPSSEWVIRSPKVAPDCCRSSHRNTGKPLRRKVCRVRVMRPAARRRPSVPWRPNFSVASAAAVRLKKRMAVVGFTAGFEGARWRNELRRFRFSGFRPARYLGRFPSGRKRLRGPRGPLPVGGRFPAPPAVPRRRSGRRSVRRPLPQRGRHLPRR